MDAGSVPAAIFRSILILTSSALCSPLLLLTYFPTLVTKHRGR